MENVYNPVSFRSSDPIHTKEYFKGYNDCFPFFHDKAESEEYLDFAIKAELGLDNTEYENLKNSCSIDLLTLPDEPNNVPAPVPTLLLTKTKLDSTYPITSAGKLLNIIQVKETLKSVEKQYLATSKKFLKTIVVSNPTTSFVNDILPGTNFIYSIIVYKPFLISYGQKNSIERLRYAFEMEALGTNNLIEVVDKIECVQNMGIYKEVENTNVDLTELKDPKKHYPSQGLFIEGVFYSDFRSPDAIDYSEVVTKWMKDKKIGELKRANMNGVLLESLTPRFGYPYVFIHYGNCEHVFVFSDARLITPEDCLISKKYPRLFSITRRLTVFCFLCSLTKAMWIVFNCERFPHDKVFLCKECCDSYLYLNGEKVCSFKLYPFHDQMFLP